MSVPPPMSNATWRHLPSSFDDRNANDSNMTRYQMSGLPFDKLSTHGVLVIASYGLVVLASTFGNALVCYVVFCMRRRGPTYVFIANLAVSDLLMTVLNVPFNVARVLLNDWPFGAFMCGFVPLVQVSSVYVSTFTMTCIAFDRYRVVTYPMKPRLGYLRALTVVALVWLLAFLFALPHALFNQVVEVFTYRWLTRCRSVTPARLRPWLTLATVLTQYVLPVSATGLVYGLVMRRVCASDVNFAAVTEAQAVNRERAKKKTIKMLVLVVILFAICWLPLNLYHVIQEFVGASSRGSQRSIVFFLCHWLAMSSVCYNPFIYCWLNEHFRAAAHACFPCIRAIGAGSSKTSDASTLQRSGQSKSSSRLNQPAQQRDSSSRKIACVVDRGRCVLQADAPVRGARTSTSTPNFGTEEERNNMRRNRSQSLCQ